MTPTLNELGKLKALLAQKESEFEVFKKQINDRIKDLSEKAIEEMQSMDLKTVHLANGTLTLTVKHTATAPTTDFTEWLKQDVSRLDFATVKIRQRETQKYVEQHGTTPAPFIKYDRFLELVYKKG